MKTLTKNNLSLYLFEDAEVLEITTENISVGNPAKLVIWDCNSNNTELHHGVTLPQDWRGGKYFFDGVDWALNPNWIDPQTLEEETSVV